MATIISSAGGLVALGIAVFTVLSHALAFASQVLRDIKKESPGWLNTATNAVAKILEILNGQKAA